MTIHFFNDNIPDGRFELRWGNEGRTPAITLNPGDMAAFDMDVFNQIPEGADCRVYAWQPGTNLFKQSVKTFKYVSGRGFAGSFEFYRRGLGLALTYYRLI